MPGIIDIRQDPAVDIANAQAIGKIFSAIGRAEQLRQKKWQIDTLLGQIQAGEPIENALDITRNQSTSAPYDTGLGGILQRVGGFLSPKVDATEGLTEKLLLEKIRQSDPAYQLGMEATRTNISGDKQRQLQSAGLYPGELAGQQLGLKSTQTNIAGAEQNQRQNAEMFPLEKKTAEQNIAGQQQRQQLATEQNQREQQAFESDERLKALREKGFITQTEYDAAAEEHKKAMRPLEKAGTQQDIEYRKKQTETFGETPIYRIGPDGNLYQVNKSTNTAVPVQGMPEKKTVQATQTKPGDRGEARDKIDKKLYGITHSGSGKDIVDKQPTAGEWEDLQAYAADYGFEVTREPTKTDRYTGLFNMFKRDEPLVEEYGNYRIVDKKTSRPTGAGQSKEPPTLTPLDMQRMNPQPEVQAVSPQGQIIPEPVSQQEFEAIVKEIYKTDPNTAKTYYDKWAGKWQ